jgi:Phosphopantetheine attachment site
MDDNFFDLGGHSLLATQLVSRLTQDHDLQVTLQMVFDAATLADLADRLVQQELAGASDQLLDQVLSEIEVLPTERPLEEAR